MQIKPLVKLKGAEGFGRSLSKETEEALKAIDDNIKRAAALAHRIFCD